MKPRPDDYRIKCQTCRHGRSFGRARLSAEYAADTHLRKYPQHVIEMHGDERLLHVRRATITPLPFDVDTDDPPY